LINGWNDGPRSAKFEEKAPAPVPAQVQAIAAAILGLTVA
jgi:hypothetical protein